MEQLSYETGVVIRRYLLSAAAARGTKIGVSLIEKAVKGVHRSAGGFVWVKYMLQLGMTKSDLVQLTEERLNDLNPKFRRCLL